MAEAVEGDIRDVGSSEQDEEASESQNGATMTDIGMLKAMKSKLKCAFTRARHKLLELFDEDDIPSRRDVRKACSKLDDAQENVTDVVTKLCEIYIKLNDNVNIEKVNNELETIERDYSDSRNRALNYLDSRKDDLSSLVSENRETASEKIRRFQTDTVLPKVDECKINDDFDRMTDIDSVIEPVINTDRPEPVAPSRPKTVSIGQDMWKQLKRVSIPVFSGDKRNYESWKAAFLACIDQAPATAEYKLLQLRQYVSGEALRVIENLGHSAVADQAAKERLDRKYGGQRRQVAIYLEQLERFRPVRSGNSRDVEQFADILDIAVVNLKEAGRDAELGNGSLYIKLQSKMTEDMLARYHRWIHETNKTESVETLREWINQEAEFQTIARETIVGLTQTKTNKVFNPHTHFVKKSEDKSSNSISRRSCKMCGSSHGIWYCEDFKKLDVAQRWGVAKQHGLCFRCLGDNHSGKNCFRSRVCGVNGCKENHNRLLHRQMLPKATPQMYNETMNEISTIQPSMEREQTNLHTTMHSDGSLLEYVTLRTVPVILKNGNRKMRVNALLDDGSTKTYVNADVAAELGLQGHFIKVNVCVLNGQVETFETMPVRLGLESVDSRVDTVIDALTTERVTGDMRTVDWRKYAKKWRHLDGIQFPQLGRRPIVDILIGMDYADLHVSIKEVCGKPKEPVARLTPLGWTCVGTLYQSREQLQTNFVRTYHSHEQSDLHNINTTFRKFWEVESCGDNSNVLSAEDSVALKTVKDSLKYIDGHYQVAIPWKDDGTELPLDNFEMAKSRLCNTEKRLLKQPEIAQSYSETLEQYLKKGYIRKVTREINRPDRKWYLPHFPVIRLDKTTTKTRIVFDAAAQLNGVSLNDTINSGPKLQQDLVNVLLRFRKSPIALVCDIAEMYLRIELAPTDRPFHRFLWRNLDQKKEPEEYEFNRVVFGVNSSPFLAQFVAQENARKLKSNFPRAAETVLKSTYMDDSMDSVECEDDAIELYSQLKQIWEHAGMHARKWLTNSHRVLSNIPADDRATEINFDDGTSNSVKTLGVLWACESDVFGFKCNPPSSKFQFTKRNVLSKVATIFDPLGFLAPYIIRAKILLQEIWAVDYDWDDPMDSTLTDKAEQWFHELGQLTDITIPRCLQLSMEEQVSTVGLHTFVDASEEAYGAVTYVRYMYKSGNISNRMVASKTRVAPLAATSIPRLELMAAVLGIKLSNLACSALNIDKQYCTFWSDSMNVLWWIRGRSRLYKPFVANRISQIQSESNPNQWRHIPTDLNPADFASRGLLVSKLTNCEMWWFGPNFLQLPQTEWPQNLIENTISYDKEMKKTKRQTYVVNEVKQIKDQTVKTRSAKTEWLLEPTRFSNWLRLKRQCAWVLRFVENSRSPKSCRRTGVLTPEEILDAEINILKHTQRDSFCEEYGALVSNRALPKNSKLLGLMPKIDDDGLIRADGRLKYAEFLSYDVRYPILLPRKHWVTTLIVKHYHELGLHVSGTNHTLSETSSRYWIIAGREAIRAWENECAECSKRKAKAGQQVMAPLPKVRLRCSLRTFATTAVDYGGPFLTIQGRGKSRAKRYLCLFTCLETRAVHLEMAYGLDTDSFLNAFFRMVNRRGLPQVMNSDNGSNFVGAVNELRDLVKTLDQSKIRTASETVKWHFNPPLAPHFGGVHETMIKSAKRAIYAILKNADVKDEELMTAFTGAEALMNSRPLTYQSTNPADDTPLTPNHFLFGQIGGKFAPENVDCTAYNPKKRWRLVQELIKHFWHRWMREWLPSLTVRKKWVKPKTDMKVGDIVLVISPDSPRGKWPLGRITKIHPGKDGHVRVVSVQVGKNVFIRPITKLCPLEILEMD